MVALSKLLVGALVQSAYGNQKLASSALKESKANITQGDCNENEYGNLTISRAGENCTINGVAIKNETLHIQVYCMHNNKTLTVNENELKLYPSEKKILSTDGTEIIVGEGTEFENDKCIKVELPINHRKTYQIKIRKFTPASLNGGDTFGGTASLAKASGEPVAESAFFGTNGGEWDILDLVGIVAACVLVCCLGLALYGCWSKKKKQEAEQRQTKYVAQNSNPSGRTGTQRRRR